MLARFAILFLAAGVVLQPLLTLAGATNDCWPAGLTSHSELVSAGDHDCCCEVEATTGQSDPSEPDRPDQRPRGCDCPKSCCTSIVKVPLGVAPACAACELRYPVGRAFSDAPGLADDAWTSRLKRPPRAFAAV